MFNKLKSYSAKFHELYSYYGWNELEVQNITFQITEDCNLKCSYCYQHNKSKKAMTFETAKEMIDKILQENNSINDYITSKKRAVILEFIGGEPFLQIELIDKIVDYFIHQLILLKHKWLLHYVINIGTNGTLYFTEPVQNFIKKHNNHLSLAITLDGNKALHDSCRLNLNGDGTYDIVEKAIRHYKNTYNKNIGTKLTLAPSNINFLFDGIKNFIDLDLTTIYFNPVFEEGWQSIHATEYYYQLKKVVDYILENNLENKVYLSQLDYTLIAGQRKDDTNWCGGTSNTMLAINPDGELYPCLRYMPSSLGTNQEPFILGTIKEGIGNTEKTKQRIKLLQTITASSQSEKKCLKCPISAGCGWCSAYNYEIFGTPNKRATFICQMHQAQVLAIKYLVNGLNKKNYNIDYQLLIPVEWALEIIDNEEFNKLIRSE